ncbi:MAG: 30S ribosomal protein S13 [bacterium]
MPRISGIVIPDNKHVDYSLTYIYGIGLALSRRILEKAKIEPYRKASDLTVEEINQLRQIIEKDYKIEGELRRQTIVAIKRLKDIGCWRGVRHQRRLPARGQKTRTNTRTVRGNTRKTVGSGKKQAATPT